MNVHSARIGDIVIARSPDVLEALALGSCVATFIFDDVIKLGACAHILLPKASEFTIKQDHNHKPGKYADLAIPEMIKLLVSKGGKRERFTAKIAGGAKMFELSTKTSSVLDVGARNIVAVKEILKEYNIPIVASDIGENFGRTVSFNLDTGLLTIKMGLKKIVKHI